MFAGHLFQRPQRAPPRPGPIHAFLPHALNNAQQTLTASSLATTDTAARVFGDHPSFQVSSLAPQQPPLRPLFANMGGLLPHSSIDVLEAGDDVNGQSTTEHTHGQRTHEKGNEQGSASTSTTTSDGEINAVSGSLKHCYGDGAFVFSATIPRSVVPAVVSDYISHAFFDLEDDFAPVSSCADMSRIFPTVGRLVATSARLAFFDQVSFRSATQPRRTCDGRVKVASERAPPTAHSTKHTNGQEEDAKQTSALVTSSNPTSTSMPTSTSAATTVHCNESVVSVELWFRLTVSDVHLLAAAFPNVTALSLSSANCDGPGPVLHSSLGHAAAEGCGQHDYHSHGQEDNRQGDLDHQEDPHDRDRHVADLLAALEVLPQLTAVTIRHDPRTQGRLHQSHVENSGESCFFSESRFAEMVSNRPCFTDGQHADGRPFGIVETGRGRGDSEGKAMGAPEQGPPARLQSFTFTSKRRRCCDASMLPSSPPPTGHGSATAIKGHVNPPAIDEGATVEDDVNPRTPTAHQPRSHQMQHERQAHPEHAASLYDCRNLQPAFETTTPMGHNLPWFPSTGPPPDAPAPPSAVAAQTQNDGDRADDHLSAKSKHHVTIETSEGLPSEEAKVLGDGHVHSVSGSHASSLTALGTSGSEPMTTTTALEAAGTFEQSSDAVHHSSTHVVAPPASSEKVYQGAASRAFQRSTPTSREPPQQQRPDLVPAVGFWKQPTLSGPSSSSASSTASVLPPFQHMFLQMALCFPQLTALHLSGTDHLTDACLLVPLSFIRRTLKALDVSKCQRLGGQFLQGLVDDQPAVQWEADHLSHHQPASHSQHRYIGDKNNHDERNHKQREQGTSSASQVAPVPIVSSPLEFLDCNDCGSLDSTVAAPHFAQLTNLRCLKLSRCFSMHSRDFHFCAALTKLERLEVAGSVNECDLRMAHIAGRSPAIDTPLSAEDHGHVTTKEETVNAGDKNDGDANDGRSSVPSTSRAPLVELDISRSATLSNDGLAHLASLGQSLLKLSLRDCGVMTYTGLETLCGLRHHSLDEARAKVEADLKLRAALTADDDVNGTDATDGSISEVREVRKLESLKKSDNPTATRHAMKGAQPTCDLPTVVKSSSLSLSLSHRRLSNSLEQSNREGGASCQLPPLACPCPCALDPGSPRGESMSLVKSPSAAAVLEASGQFTPDGQLVHSVKSAENNDRPTRTRLSIADSGAAGENNENEDGQNVMVNTAPPLLWLDLVGCRHVGDEGLLCVAEFSKLTALSLWCTAVTDFGLRVLSKALPKLACLELPGCQRITNAGLFAICSFPHLTSLSLRRCIGVDASGLSTLSLMKDRLKTLNISENYAVTDEAMVAVAELPRLKVLVMQHSVYLTDAGLSTLLRGAPCASQSSQPTNEQTLTQPPPTDAVAISQRPKLAGAGAADRSKGNTTIDPISPSTRHDGLTIIDDEQTQAASLHESGHSGAGEGEAGSRAVVSARSVGLSAAALSLSFIDMSGTPDVTLGGVRGLSPCPKLRCVVVHGCAALSEGLEDDGYAPHPFDRLLEADDDL